MKVVNWNIEWFDNLFEHTKSKEPAAFRKSNPRHGVKDVPALAKRIASVLIAVNPDVLCVEEGPSCIEKMQLFVDTYLGGAYSCVTGGSHGTQRMYVLAKCGSTSTGSAVSAIKRSDDELTRALFKPWPVDINGDMELETYHFTREPLVVDVCCAATDKWIRVVVLHSKSKYVRGGQHLWRDVVSGGREEFIRRAVVNRRRISAEAMRVREYLDDLLCKNYDREVIVTGDFNDGPGLDYFERHFLMHNVTTSLMGSAFYPELMFEHALIGRVPRKLRWTIIHDDFVDNVTGRHLLLDHVLVSPGLQKCIADAGVCHAAYDAACDAQALRRKDRARQSRPSDHKPVYCTLDLTKLQVSASTATTTPATSASGAGGGAGATASAGAT